MISSVGTQNNDYESLSARRAWIEINRVRQTSPGGLVALRKESVDRNRIAQAGNVPIIESLSARRAWIEISVLMTLCRPLTCRSPQGERG